MSELVLTNARIIAGSDTVAGTLVVRGGVIADIQPGRSRSGMDLDGDLVLPGFVELHTDHLETHFRPRPGVWWDPAFAVQGHDAQVAAAGITTVFDALAIGLEKERLGREATLELVEAVKRAGDAGLLKAEHHLHLRCEVPSPTVVEMMEAFAGHPLLRLASLMDHTPGQRQFTDLTTHKRFNQAKHNLTDEAYEAMVAERRQRAALYLIPNRKRIVDICRARGIVMASHDDATPTHIEEAIDDGVTIAEFPTTAEAAAAATTHGLKVLMGAPNIVRGGSHTGNVSALALATEHRLDMLSSDYVPLSLIQAVFMLPQLIEGMTLPDAVALVTLNPARSVGLTDRGLIAPGQRADLVRVREAENVRGRLPVVREVWREGRRIV